MKILILGFYNHDNIGDEMFIDVYKKLFPDATLEFREISSITSEKINNYQRVIVGAGDLMNDFYGTIYDNVLANYTGYKAAIGVGFSFSDCCKRKYVTHFDDIFIRNETDLTVVSQMVGSSFCHSIPDIGYHATLNHVRDKNNTNKTIGIFLVGSLVNNLSFLFSLMMFINWLILSGFTIELIPMYTEESITDNDLVINDYIMKTFAHTNKVTNNPKMSFEKFIEKCATLQFAICIRYHAHVFCSRLGIPFLSLPITRKDEIFLAELPSNCVFTPELTRDTNYNVLSFNVDKAKDLFSNMRENQQTITDSLLYYSEKKSQFFDSGKIQRIVNRKTKRTTTSNRYYIMQPEEIYLKYLQEILSYGINPNTDKLTDMLSIDKINRIADNLCYDITRDSANEYAFGTRINLKDNPQALRDMIYWIYYDYLSKLYIPSINLSYIKQDSFKGLHRSGWQFAIDSLYSLSDDRGVFCDTYLDRTFGWAKDMFVDSGVLPYTNRWIGFFHHTFETEYTENNCTRVFTEPLFLQSLHLCRGIFCLTKYLSTLVKQALIKVGFGNILVETLYHPTEFPKCQFTFAKFLANNEKKLINVGAWYRNPVTIHTISSDYLQICSLKGKRMDANFCPDSMTFNNINNTIICNTNINNTTNTIICNTNTWTKYFSKLLNTDERYKYLKDHILANPNNISKEDSLLKSFLSNVKIIDTLDNDKYDELISSNIVFLDLVDASTANTIIECIVRNTPLVVNKIAPVVEALGEDYPLYYEDPSQVSELLTEENIKKTYEYLSTMDKEVYRLEHFYNSFNSSEIIKSIKI
jgi:hypothetical protein